MIYQIKDPLHVPLKIISSLGQSLSKGNSSLFKLTGSCLYNVRSISFKDETEMGIRENARCNFERFENGYLLRINDNQNYFVLPLGIEDKWNLKIQEGEEFVRFRSLTYCLLSFGVKSSFLKKYWILSYGFYYARFKLELTSDEFHIIFDAHGSEFKSTLKYFSLNKQKELRFVN